MTASYLLSLASAFSSSETTSGLAAGFGNADPSLASVLPFLDGVRLDQPARRGPSLDGVGVNETDRHGVGPCQRV